MSQKNSKLLFVILMLTLTLTGCLVLSVPSFGHKVTSGKRIQAEDISFVRPGQTTRDELVVSFGDLLAAGQGDSKAKRNVSMLELMLSQEQISEGKRWAQDWLEQGKPVNHSATSHA